MPGTRYERKFKKRISEIEKEKGISGKNDHYVPQFLLRNFAIEENGRKTDYIFEYKRQALVPSRILIESAASELGYYDTKRKSTKEKNNLADRLMQPIESDASVIIKKLISCSSVRLNNKEENSLASFVANLYTRTPAFREQIKRFLQYLIENKFVKIEELKDEKLLNEIFNENKFNIDIQMLRKYKPEIDIEYKSEDLLIIISLLVAAKLSEDLFYRHVNILESDADDFLINDNPVFISDLKKYPRWPAGWNFTEEEVVFMPICRNRCLVYDNKPFNKKIISADSDLAAFITFNLIVGTETYLYSFIDDKDIQNGLNSTPKMRERVFPISE